MAFILGITGSIATGKSTVVAVFKELGFPVVDGDVIAREILEPNQRALREVVAAFGKDILKADGSLNREKLGKLIFSNEGKRKQLNQILDPFLRQAILQQIKIASENSPLVIADIPLLYEAGYEGDMDQVAVVYVSPKVQLERLIKRDQISPVEAQKKIASQLSIEEKARLTDLIFDNQGSKAETSRQVLAWLEENNFK